MGSTERLFLWVILGVVLVGWIVSTTVLFNEIGTVNRQLLALTGGTPVPDEPPGPGGGLEDLPPSTASSGLGGQKGQVAVAGVEVLSDTVAMTVTVRAYGIGDLLFEPPVLRAAEGQVYPVTGASLEQARLAFLDLVTRSEATARFEFAGRLAPTGGLWLVFNPTQEEGSVTAPPLQVAVPLATGVSLTPEPTEEGMGE
jgi:hypothetical protein